MSNLILTNDTYRKITDYVRLIDAEIGMFGYVTMNDGDFIVDDVFLVKQTVSGTSVDFTDEGLEFAIDKAIKDGRIDDLKFCCHSHVDMGAFWSKTDEDMIEGMNNGMTPYLVSLVINKKHETEQRVDFFNPPGDIGAFTSQLTFDLDLIVSHADDAERQAEIDDLVSEQRLVYTRTSRKRTHKPLYGSEHWLPDTAELPITNAAGDIIGYLDSDSEFHDLISDDDDPFSWDARELEQLAIDHYKDATP